ASPAFRPEGAGTCERAWAGPDARLMVSRTWDVSSSSGDAGTHDTNPGGRTDPDPGFLRMGTATRHASRGARGRTFPPVFREDVGFRDGARAPSPRLDPAAFMTLHPSHAQTETGRDDGTLPCPSTLICNRTLRTESTRKCK